MALLGLPSLLILLASTFFAQFASAKAPPLGTKLVFAHVIVNNTHQHKEVDWANEFILAKAGGIDAFALNIAYPVTYPEQVALAFSSAERELGGTFRLFLSFDYIHGEPWPATGPESVVSYLQNYTNTTVYQKYGGEELPFVSTRGGFAESPDWGQSGIIRSVVGDVFFAPDYTGSDPEATPTAEEVYQCFFNFDLWPDGAHNKTAASDLAFKHEVGTCLMMGVSPWYFHSAHPGKNWVWRGDDLWHRRWEQVLEVNPDFVEIVSWNDYGSSNYINRIYYKSEAPAASINYLEDHFLWINILSYYISKYKGTSYEIVGDTMQFWYHTSPTAGGKPCGVVGNNNEIMGQTEIPANEVVEDGIFFTALLKGTTTVSLKVGSFPETNYTGHRGINHWSQPFNGQTGEPVFSIVRGSELIGRSFNGENKNITATTTLSNGCTNYNPWVGELFLPFTCASGC